MEAGVQMDEGVLGRPAEDGSDDRPPRAKGGNASGGLFSKELISFSLYGKIPRKSSESNVCIVFQGLQLIIVWINGSVRQNNSLLLAFHLRTTFVDGSPL